MKTSLKNSPDKDETVKDAPPVADEAVLADMEGDNLPVQASTMSLALGNVTGSVDSRDLIIPKLNIVQGVGPLSEVHTGGDLVLNKETVLAPVNESVNLTVLSIKKTYEERLPYDANGPRPEVYETIEEVVKQGHWIEWRNKVAPPVREVATVLVLIEKPEGTDSLGFSHEILGKEYALAIWILRGTGYARGAKKIFSANSIELAQSGLLSGAWALSSERTRVNGNYVFAPVLRITGKNTPEMVEAIKEKLS